MQADMNLNFLAKKVQALNFLSHLPCTNICVNSVRMDGNKTHYHYPENLVHRHVDLKMNIQLFLNNPSSLVKICQQALQIFNIKSSYDLQNGVKVTRNKTTLRLVLVTIIETTLCFVPMMYSSQFAENSH